MLDDSIRYCRKHPELIDIADGLIERHNQIIENDVKISRLKTLIKDMDQYTKPEDNLLTVLTMMLNMKDENK